MCDLTRKKGSFFLGGEALFNFIEPFPGFLLESNRDSSAGTFPVWFALDMARARIMMNVMVMAIMRKIGLE